MTTCTPHDKTRGKGAITPSTEPPQSIEAEQSTLGGLILDNGTWSTINRLITTADFYRADHQLIFKAISTLAGQDRPFDVVTLSEQLESQQQLDDAGGTAYLATLALHTPSTINAHAYAEIVREKSLQRKRLAAIARNDHEQAAAITAAIKALKARSKTASPYFMDISDLCSKPPAENWLIKNYMTTDSLGLLFGDPGCGKSFIAIDIACHVATGRPWRDQPVKQGLVLYIAGEGRNGLAKRFRAWFERHEETLHNIKISTAPIALTDPASITALVAEIRALPDSPILIIVDTINRNYGPGDENATADMTRAVTSLDTLRTTTGATLFGLHHSGHADKGRGRGSSVLRASLDCEFAVEKFDQTVRIHCTKAKDFDPPPPLSWTFAKQVLPWADADGYPIDSAVLIPCDLPAPTPKPSTTRMGTNQAKALDLLRKLYQQHYSNLEAGGFDPATAKVTRQDWYTAMEAAGLPRNRRTDAKAELVQRRLIREDNGFIYLTDVVPDFVPDFVPE